MTGPDPGIDFGWLAGQTNRIIDCAVRGEYGSVGPLCQAIADRYGTRGIWMLSMGLGHTVARQFADGQAELHIANGNRPINPEDLPPQMRGDLWAARWIVAHINDDVDMCRALFSAVLEDDREAVRGLFVLIRIVAGTMRDAPPTPAPGSGHDHAAELMDDDMPTPADPLGRPIDVQALAALVGAALDRCRPCQAEAVSPVAASAVLCGRMVELACGAVTEQAGGIPPIMADPHRPGSQLSVEFRSAVAAGMDRTARDTAARILEAVAAMDEPGRVRVVEDAVGLLVGVMTVTAEPRSTNTDV